ncbi:Uncharacterised protein [Raoultella terrigena]|uniref:Uncharacterized protein n=1 Tax=Raoultella terrigena TaxID=577 RepID=A0A3P8KMF1_RAOTE|nr:Uncharacterised protein [Raoultella terrigena]
MMPTATGIFPLIAVALTAVVMAIFGALAGRAREING